jgi:hypothetical protein
MSRDQTSAAVSQRRGVFRRRGDNRGRQKFPRLRMDDGVSEIRANECNGFDNRCPRDHLKSRSWYSAQ